MVVDSTKDMNRGLNMAKDFGDWEHRRRDDLRHGDGSKINCVWDSMTLMDSMVQSLHKNKFEFDPNGIALGENPYGDTALNPTNVFSKLNATEALCARLDDKLARIKNKGINDETEDTVDDLIGYLLLLKISISGR